jgi:hypothetical protein
MSDSEEPIEPRTPMERANYLPAPAYFKLDHACQFINSALGGFGCYLVGSSARRKDWRDVDVRYILDDDIFDRLFPGVGDTNPSKCALWSLMCVTISDWLSRQTDLPIDFQIQRQSMANAKFKSRDGHSRSALGIFLAYPGGG